MLALMVIAVPVLYLAARYGRVLAEATIALFPVVLGTAVALFAIVYVMPHMR